MNLDNVVQFPSFYSAESEYVSSLYKKVDVKTEVPVQKVVEPVISSKPDVKKNAIVQEIEKAREQIKSTLSGNLV